MRVVHYPASGGGQSVLATDVELATSRLEQARGLMFRRSIPDDYALAFIFDASKIRDVHMLFVFVSIDAIWVADGVVTQVKPLRPWLGFGRADADLLLELPAGTAADVEAGDRIVLTE